MKVLSQHEQRLLQQKAKAIGADLSTEIVEESYLNPDYLTRLLTNYTDSNQAILLLDINGTKLASVTGAGWEQNPWSADEADAIIYRTKIHLPVTASDIWLLIAERKEPLDSFIRILFINLFLASFGALLLSGFGGYAMTKLGLKPLDRLVVHIRDMNAHQLSARMSDSHVAAELGELVSAFNSLLDRVEESMKRQQQFVADASHELKTPLTIIDGYVRLLQRWGKHTSEVREEALAAIQQECGRLSRLIQDLLILAKVQRAPFAIQNIEIQSLVPVLQEVKQAWGSVFPHHIELTVQWREPLLVAIDRERIRQLLDILLDNAKKYTEKGSVSVYAYTERDVVCIDVEDTGIGIPQEELPHVFDRFYRVDKARGRSNGGSGLGLAIAQSIVQLHRGHISIKRTVTGGTKVHVTLPSAQLNEQE